MKKMIMVAAVSLVSTVTLAAPDFSELDRTVWQKKGVDSENQYTLFLELNAEDSARLQIGGRGACNQYFGSIAATDNGVEVGPIGSTLMHCGPEQAGENAFFSALYDTADFEVQNGELVLFERQEDQSQSVLLVLERRVDLEQ